MEHTGETVALTSAGSDEGGSTAPRVGEMAATLLELLEQLTHHRAAIASACDRLDNNVHSLGAGISRLERKLDRILAVSLDLRGRNRQ
jgi:ABC-type transporter Mla subunit MlaD